MWVFISRILPLIASLTVIYLVIFAIEVDDKKKQDFAKFKLFLKSMMIFLLIWIIAYTIYFIYHEIVVLPAEYALMDGKGGHVQKAGFYCDSFFGRAYKCGIFELVYQYFVFGFLCLLIWPSLFERHPIYMIGTLLVAIWATIYFYTKHKK